MEHTLAISAWLTPLLLMIIAYYLKRFLDKNRSEEHTSELQSQR